MQFVDSQLAASKPKPLFCKQHVSTTQGQASLKKAC